MLVPGSTRRAGAVPGQRHDRDVVTHGPSGHPIAEGRDHPAHLVPEDGRHRHPAIHLPVQHMQVGAADPGVRDLDLYLTGLAVARARLARMAIEALPR